MSSQNIVDFLRSIGCCERCILIYLGVRSEALYVNAASVCEEIVKACIELDKEVEDSGCTPQLQLIPENASTNAETQEASAKEMIEDEPSEQDDMDPLSKKQKLTVCITCIGLLQTGCSNAVNKQISDAMLLRGPHDAEAFTLAVSLPVCLQLRVHRVWTLLLQKFPQFTYKGRPDYINSVKDVWKNLVGPQLAKSLNMKFVQGQYLEFVMNVSATYVGDKDDCKILDKLCESMFSIRRKQHKKYAFGVYTKQSVDTAIKKIKDAEFLKAYPEPPPPPVEAVSFTDLKWQRDALYLAGRYNKYSRELPQTPWFVEGERKMGSSVQELIADILNGLIKAEESKFSSSGREDVDVRCLGRGRPFVLEFINPCFTKLSTTEIMQVQKAVNASSNLISLQDLQIVDKKDVKKLKEGEEEKTKAYCALCIGRDGYKPATLPPLSDMKELVLQQKTPLRVLHRRPLLVRPRIIHEMKASSIDNIFFKLHLTTQAGTYIKEFIHGDLGRTTPSLKTILGCDVDIIALDVERVALDWPPKCDN